MFESAEHMSDAELLEFKCVLQEMTHDQDLAHVGGRFLLIEKVL